MIRSAAAWLAVVLCSAPSLGSGFYNMPTRGQQCLGVGFGPGYHAPMLLVRPWRAPVAGQGISWVRAPLRPESSAYEVAIHPQAGGSPWGPTDAADHFSAPSVLAAPTLSAPTRDAAPLRGEVLPRPAAPPKNQPAIEPASPSDNLRPDPVALPSAWRPTQRAVR